MSSLEEIIERVGEVLPAQGPISVFIHHNTLHAFEDHLFEEAIVQGSQTFGCEPFLHESRYRQELQRGRITADDLDAVLDAEQSGTAQCQIVHGISQRELRRRILLHGIPPPGGGTQLQWLLSETDVLRAPRQDVPDDALRSAARDPALVADLWRACCQAVDRSSCTVNSDRRSALRHRDILHAATNIDTDAWVHPLLIAFTSAYLDQGLADWAMPARERGLYACFVDLYGSRLTRFCRPLGKPLRRLLRDESSRFSEARASLQHSLAVLGVPAQEWQSFLTAEALALRGFAGMVRQFEQRPDRVPTVSLPARLVDFLAIRLLLTRAALHCAIDQASLRCELADLRACLPLADPPRAGTEDRAWPLFHASQLCGLDATAVRDLTDAQVTDFEQELGDFDSLAQRRLFQLAYERHLRHHFYDAVVQHEERPTPATPPFQALFCIDDREESFRRHLEEVDPDVETFGVAGFFGVAMYYRAATDAHPRALCPVAVQPQHYVGEAGSPPDGLFDRLRASWDRFGALVDKNVHVGSRQFGRGAVLMATLGVLWIVPLVLRVLFPRSRRVAAYLQDRFRNESYTRLQVHRTDDTPAIGQHSGFTEEEMAQIVRGQLAPTGILDRLAPLVVVVGHGSISLNNPQESAHDCGACGGGRGGPNARAFAQMANDAGVRTRLAALGVRIPSTTWFVGGQRNTANNDLHLFDEDLVPDTHRQVLHRVRTSLRSAQQAEAHERCRRFLSAPLSLPGKAALFHVQARAADLAQPRPEYGHATNAICVIGRRALTRGLFLDRRAFLVSYDPTHDLDSAALASLLAAVIPVVVGISLEYFFGYIDPTGYGCGTKLPHNVTGLLGVMDGAQSDLRTGLPWQMLEIHEPVRLSVVVETSTESLQRLLQQDDDLRRLVHNRWLFIAALDPDSRRLEQIDADGATPHTPQQPQRRVRGPSRAHYGGQRDHLPFVSIDSDGAMEAA